jgi:hypothetical protein
MRYVVLVTVLYFAFTRPAFAATSPPLTDAEKAFIAKASATIDSEYPTTATAKSAGFTLLVGDIFDDNTYDWTNMQPLRLRRRDPPEVEHVVPIELVNRRERQHAGPESCRI